MQKWLTRTLAALVVVAASGCTTSRATVTPPAVALRAPAAAGSLRVMTFNVKSCTEGIERVAAAIRAAQPDVVALQEVDNGTTRAQGLDQARELAALVGMEHVAHIPATRMHGGDYGMALLSRLPIRKLSRHRLPVEDGMEPRIVAHAILDADGTEVSLYKTHLSPMPERGALRAEQADLVARLMARDHRPKILMGDLNDGASSAAVRRLTRNLQDTWAIAGKGRAGTYPLPVVGTFRFDYVLASEHFEVRQTFVMPGDASDHYPVVSDLELPRPAVAEREAD